MKNNKIVCGLIRGRHDMPVAEYIFDEAIKDVHDYCGIRKHIQQYVLSHMNINITCGIPVNGIDDAYIYAGDTELIVYVTGLTPVTVELVKVCLFNGIPLTLMNYDISTCEYREQVVFCK